MTKLEESTKIVRKIETPSSSKARKSNESSSAEAKKERTNRYRKEILYDDDDENTSNPKLEKAIEQDKERIEEERKQWLDKKKPKTPSSNSREEKSKQKMESSSDKFKMFVSDDTADKSMDQPESTNANISHNVDGDDSDNDQVVEVKTKSPAKTGSNNTPSSRATGSQSSASVTPSHHAWKTRPSSPFTSNEKNAKKRSRRLSSSDEDVPNVRVQVDQILRGVVFVISGIQVHNFMTFKCIFIEISFKIMIFFVYCVFRIQHEPKCVKKVSKWAQSTNRIGKIHAHI